MEKNLEILHESPASTVYKTRVPYNQSFTPGCLSVVKSASAYRAYSPEPHDILKEAQIISQVSHQNIINTLRHGYQEIRPDLYNIWMPFIPYSLNDLLRSPQLSPKSPPFEILPSEHSKTIRESSLTAIVRSLAWQIVAAIVYLHDTDHRIAHRDIKPGNILLAHSGCVKLIDFGVSYRDKQIGPENDQLWPETPNSMYTQVCTGPYRAPELLFGARSYDPYAVDLWSLGATLAEFYTPLLLELDDSDSDSETSQSEDSKSAVIKPFVVPKGLTPKLERQWKRDSLFDASRGDIGLAWSIFQIRGTPDEINWPGFLDLPHARKLTFNTVPAVPLQSRLPNLPCPPQTALAPHSPEDVVAPAHLPDASSQLTPLDLIHRLLVYPPLRRLRASEALLHPWFADDVILLPSEYTVEEGTRARFASSIAGRSLGEHLARHYSFKGLAEDD